MHNIITLFYILLIEVMCVTVCYTVVCFVTFVVQFTSAKYVYFDEVFKFGLIGLDLRSIV